MEGTLYGGQPYCPQGPITYIVAKLFDSMPGDIEMNVQLGSLIMLFGIFLIIYLWGKKVAKENFLLLLNVFFFLFFMRIAEDDFASIVATLFLITGCFFLFVYSQTHKDLFAGICLGLSLFSKAQFILGIVPSLFFYYFQKKDNTKELLYSIIRTILPITALFLFFKIIFPNFITYYYIAQSKHIAAMTIWQAISVVMTGQYIYNCLFFLFYISLFISIFRIIHKKAIDLYSCMCFFVFLGMMILMLNAYEITKITETYRFFFLIMPFYLINLSLFKNEFPLFNKKLKIIFGVIFIGVLIVFYQMIGGLTFQDIADGSVFDEQRLIKKIQQEISFPLFEIPKQEGKILVSYNYSELLSDRGNPFLYLDDTDFENIEFKDPYAEDRPDMSYAPYLVDMGVVDSLENYSPNIEINLTEVNIKFLNQEYKAIIIPPYADSLSRLLFANKESLSIYCGVSVGALPIGYSIVQPTRYFILFQDKKSCEYLNAKTIQYYTSSFKKLCNRGSYVYIIIEDIFQKNKQSLNQECSSSVHTIDYMVPAHFKALYLSFFIILFTLYVILKNIKETYSNGT